MAPNKRLHPTGADDISGPGGRAVTLGCLFRIEADSRLQDDCSGLFSCDGRITRKESGPDVLESSLPARDERAALTNRSR